MILAYLRQEFLWSWMWSISIRTEHGPFQNTVPDYYYRMVQMVVKMGLWCCETTKQELWNVPYMIDSLTHWSKSNSDRGFRFDLYSIRDDVIREVHGSSHSFFTGEGWDMGTDCTRRRAKTMQQNCSNWILFNDTERDAIKGAEVCGSIKRGFVKQKINRVYRCACCFR